MHQQVLEFLQEISLAFLLQVLPLVDYTIDPGFVLSLLYFLVLEKYMVELNVDMPVR